MTLTTACLLALYASANETISSYYNQFNTIVVIVIIIFHFDEYLVN